MNAILQVENLTKQYADFKLDHVSFSVPKGTIMGLIGENGAGKSTTINAILDLIHKDDGTVTFWGQELSSTKQIKEDVGVVFDGINFYETLTPAKVGKIAGAAYKQWDGHLFQDYLKRFQLPADKEIKSLSKGMKMKLCIAVALSHNPKLLILDEATSGLDPVMRDDILDVFLEFVQDENHSILMSSHITTDLEKVADYITFIRQGKVLGSRSYFPKVPGGTELGEVVETFVGQFYLQGSQMRTLPSEILLDFTLDDKTLLAESLSELAGRRVNVQTKPRGDRARYLKLARTNAATALTTKLSQQSTVSQRLTALATLLKLPEVKRMECFDISHTMGEQTVASCVVFDANGPLRAEYRRYNITGITPGDDYAAMNQVLRRRYGKAIEESKIPDVILIDGGKGQLGQAKAVFESLDVEWDKNHPLLLGVAKGADRKAGLETLFFEPEGEGFSLPPDSPALHVIQHIRDESHDHAISGHRKKRAKVKNTSTLETIEGVGPKRRQMLLKYMGGLQGLLNASMEEIAKVPGISQGLAEKIYYSLKH